MPAKARLREEAHRQHRRRRAALPGDEGRQQREPDARARRARSCSSSPAPAAHDPEHEPEQADARERHAGQVEPVVGAEALAQRRARPRREQQPDRHVEPEDPVPGDALDDRAADHRAERDAEAADPAPDADRQPALLGRERLAQQRQRQRRDRPRAPRPCSARAAISASVLGANAARGGGEREHPDADREHPPPAEPVAERGGGEQEDRVAERVGVDRPLELLERCTEVLADADERVGDDEVVEGDHEQRDRDDRERELAVAAHAGSFVID